MISCNLQGSWQQMLYFPAAPPQEKLSITHFLRYCLYNARVSRILHRELLYVSAPCSGEGPGQGGPPSHLLNSLIGYLMGFLNPPNPFNDHHIIADNR